MQSENVYVIGLMNSFPEWKKQMSLLPGATGKNTCKYINIHLPAD